MENIVNYSHALYGTLPSLPRNKHCNFLQLINIFGSDQWPGFLVANHQCYFSCKGPEHMHEEGGDEVTQRSSTRLICLQTVNAILIGSTRFNIIISSLKHCRILSLTFFLLKTKLFCL